MALSSGCRTTGSPRPVMVARSDLDCTDLVARMASPRGLLGLPNEAAPLPASAGSEDAHVVCAHVSKQAARTP